MRSSSTAENACTISFKELVRRRSISTNKKLRVICESFNISAIRPMTAFFRLPAMAGVSRASANSREPRITDSNARNSSRAAAGLSGDPSAVTTSARAFAYRVAIPERVMSIYLVSPRGPAKPPMSLMKSPASASCASGVMRARIFSAARFTASSAE